MPATPSSVPHSSNPSNTSGFDTLIQVLGGALLGSAAVGSLSFLFGTPDTDLTRWMGISVGAGLVLAQRIKH